jgi:hypothetical protein
MERAKPRNRLPPRERRILRRRSLMKRITAVYSNRVPVDLPQAVKIRFPSASKIWIVAL